MNTLTRLSKKSVAVQGEFDQPHSITIDAKGRVFVGDRANHRIQIFDQDGRYLDEWKDYGSPSGTDIDKDGTLYSADAGMGIFIGDGKTGKVTEHVPHPDFEQRDKDRVIGWSDVAIDFKGTLNVADVA